jgi:hypothetical protein
VLSYIQGFSRNWSILISIGVRMAYRTCKGNLGTSSGKATHPSTDRLALAKKRTPNTRLGLLDIEDETFPKLFRLREEPPVIKHPSYDIIALRHMVQMARQYLLISTVRERMRPPELTIGHLRDYSASEPRLKFETVGVEVLKLWTSDFPFCSPLTRTLTEWSSGAPPMSYGKMASANGPSPSSPFPPKLCRQSDVLYAIAKVRRPQAESTCP